jgi:hypothetical protein
VNGKENYTNYTTFCSTYLKKKYGEYFFIQVASIETDDKGQFPDLIFKNLQGIIVARLSKDIYLTNRYHFSGNIKSRTNGKCERDAETLLMYYQILKENTRLITDANVSYETFVNLSKSDLLPYFKAITQNQNLLDYMRINKSAYFHYERNEYTMEVFLEPWGFQ